MGGVRVQRQVLVTEWISGLNMNYKVKSCLKKKKGSSWKEHWTGQQEYRAGGWSSMGHERSGKMRTPERAFLWHLLDKRRHRTLCCWANNNMKIQVSFRNAWAESRFPLIKAVSVCAASVTCLVFGSYVDRWAEERGPVSCLFSKSTAQL